MPTDYWWGTGRRKTSVARVRMRPGTGLIEINGKALDEYFPRLRHRKDILMPLQVTGAEGRYDVIVKVAGGGPSGQAGAVGLGVARALGKADGTTLDALKEHKLMTRDPRMVERKKFGLHKARRAHQYSKR